MTDVDAVDAQEGSGATFYGWFRALGGADVLWHLDLRRPPGQMQTWAVIDCG